MKGVGVVYTCTVCVHTYMYGCEHMCVYVCGGAERGQRGPLNGPPKVNGDPVRRRTES